MLKYKEVDEGNYQIGGNAYNEYALDDQIASGVGDCNVFGSLSAHLFEILQKRNPHLASMYVGQSHYGKNNFHVWTEIYFKAGGQLYVSSVDLSRTTRKNKNIKNDDSFFFSNNEPENMLRFYDMFWSRWDCRKQVQLLFNQAYKEAKASYLSSKNATNEFEHRTQYLNLYDSKNK